MTRLLDRLGWVLAALVSLAVLAAVAGLVAAGPLDPTAPPGSTGKNVITSLPFTINQPGSYVLNGNLTCTACTSGQHGITISADDVNIDLQGFELVGTPSAGSGIRTDDPTQPPYPPTRHNTGIRNGVIRDWAGWGVFMEDGRIDSLTVRYNGYGIRAGEATISNCDVSSSTLGSGISDFRGKIDHCRAAGNAGVGIYAGPLSTLANVYASFNGDTEIQTGLSATIENCVADGGAVSNLGAGNGIEVGADSVVRGCTALGNQGSGIVAGDGSTLESCTSTNNFNAASDGIRVGSRAIIRGCTARNNGGVEIKAGDGSTLDDCLADGNDTAGNGIEVGHDGTIRGCTARNNGGHEILAGNQVNIEHCVADGWTGSARGAGDGVQVGSKSIVKGCIVTNNAGSGISTAGDHNRLEDNEITDNTGWGIYLYYTPGGNVVIGNRSQANGGDCWDPGNNAFVKVTGANYATVTHPGWNICG